MFDIGWSELAVIAVVALIVIGPKDLPKVLRTAGYWMRKVRAMASEFQTSIEQMAREADLEDLRKQVEEANKAKQALEDQLSADAAKIAAQAGSLLDDPSVLPAPVEPDAHAPAPGVSSSASVEARIEAGAAPPAEPPSPEPPAAEPPAPAPGIDHPSRTT
jgi:sec-independent protein translocase protein TatB